MDLFEPFDHSDSARVRNLWPTPIATTNGAPRTTFGMSD
jgi:hypothetical protein